MLVKHVRFIRHFISKERWRYCWAQSLLNEHTFKGEYKVNKWCLTEKSISNWRCYQQIPSLLLTIHLFLHHHHKKLPRPGARLPPHTILFPSSWTSNGLCINHINKITSQCEPLGKEKIFHCSESRDYIWVSFARTGICPVECPFFEIFGSLLRPNRMSYAWILNGFWEYGAITLLGKLNRSPRPHYTTLHYAQLDPHTLYCTMLLLSKRPISGVEKANKSCSMC